MKTHPCRKCGVQTSAAEPLCSACWYGETVGIDSEPPKAAPVPRPAQLIPIVVPKR